jgi:hypothetical protein
MLRAECIGYSLNPFNFCDSLPRAPTPMLSACITARGHALIIRFRIIQVQDWNVLELLSVSDIFQRQGAGSACLVVTVLCEKSRGRTASAIVC